MTALLQPGLADAALRPVGDWHPARFTPPLREDFTTEGDKLLAFVDRHWRTAQGDVIVLDAWQRWLIRRLLETYPPDWPVEHLRGQLRYRQVVVSMGRQNGKSVIGAILAFYFLALHVRGPRVIGVASVENQAKIVYDRVKYAIEVSPVLSREISTTKTRGIHRRDKTGSYFTLPAKEETAQGEPISGALYDELHLGDAALWDAFVLGQSSVRNALLVGLTTAGDDDSLLLKRLYGEGEDALRGEKERFGFFVWEAPDRELTEANVIAANPAVACGRKPLDVAMDDARTLWKAPRDERGVLGRDRCIRYVLNRFLEGTANAWASAADWDAGARDDVVIDGDVVFGMERSADESWGAITATAKGDDGKRYTRLLASLEHPSHERFVAAGVVLAARGPCTFAMPADTMGRVADELKLLGHDVWKLGATEMQAAASRANALIGQRVVLHPGDPLLKTQMPRTKRRDVGESWRISRTLTIGECDAVLATVAGLYVAEVRPADVEQIIGF